MSYCSNCGKELRANANFCDHCGKPQTVRYNDNFILNGSKNQIHCPVCKSTNIIHILHSQSSNGTGAAIGLNSGITIGNINSKSSHEYRWLCKNCGITFERIEEINDKISHYKTVQAMAILCTAVALIATICALITRIYSLMVVTIPCVAIFGGIFGIAYVSANSYVAKKSYLEKNCFD